MSDANSVAELATQFANYGNYVVGFALVQGVAFAYGLGQKDSPIAAWAVNYKRESSRMLIGGCAAYVLAVLVCAAGELCLRRASSQFGIVVAWSIVAIAGRVLIVVATFLLMRYAISKQSSARQVDIVD